MKKDQEPSKLKVHRPGGGPSFWFGDTFTATKKRGLDTSLSYYQKEEVAFNSLKNFGLVRGDYRYVQLVDGRCGGIGDCENTSAQVARQRLQIPEKYAFLNLSEAVCLACLRFFASDYKRVVTNLLGAIEDDKPLDTKAIEHLLFKKGRGRLDFTEAPTLTGKRKRSESPSPTSPARGNTPVGSGREEAVGETEDQLDPQNDDSPIDWDSDTEEEILMSLMWLFEKCRGEHCSHCKSVSATVRKEKAEQAMEAMGMNTSFPIYEELGEILSECEHTTLRRATAMLGLRDETGIKTKPETNLNCVITLFILREMASDLHRLVVGIRQLIKSGDNIGKEGLTHLLYNYDIGSEDGKGLVGTHTGGVPVCDEREAREHVVHCESVRAQRAQYAQVD